MFMYQTMVPLCAFLPVKYPRPLLTSGWLKQLSVLEFSAIFEIPTIKIMFLIQNVLQCPLGDATMGYLMVPRDTAYHMGHSNKTY